MRGLRLAVMKRYRYSRIKIQSAMLAKVPNVGFVLGEEGGGEEEREEEKDWAIGRFGDWAIGRCLKGFGSASWRMEFGIWNL